MTQLSNCVIWVIVIDGISWAPILHFLISSIGGMRKWRKYKSVSVLDYDYNLFDESTRFKLRLDRTHVIFLSVKIPVHIVFPIHFRTSA